MESKNSIKFFEFLAGKKSKLPRAYSSSPKILLGWNNKIHYPKFGIIEIGSIKTQLAKTLTFIHENYYFQENIIFDLKNEFSLNELQYTLN